MEEYAIGIDLGTTHCCVAVFRDGKTEVFENDVGTRTTPSYVAFTDKERFVGNEAKNHALLDPTNTVFDSKRMIGRPYSDHFVQNDIKLWPFTVLKESDKPKISVMYKKREATFFPEEISAMILTKMKEIAEDKIGERVTKAVITVPAYFNDRQRQATKDAATVAGLTVTRLINEPTAAAVAFAMDKKSDKKINVLVYDLGGGTFDVSVLTIENGSIVVKSVNGDTHLGGGDFDALLVDYLIDEIKIKHKTDLRKAKYKRSVLTLRSACETAKKSLSNRLDARIEIGALFDGVNFKTTIKRATFEEICDTLIRQTLIPLQQALQDANLKKGDIDEVLLVGGSTRIPKVQKLLSDFFEGKKLNKSINPDEAVAVGAAIQAALLEGETDELIANLSLRDVTALSYGVSRLGGLMSVIIPRNTPYPAKKEEVFRTLFDFQPRVNIDIFQGERELTKDNHLLGHFVLNNLPIGWRGFVLIDVIMEIDCNGILKVSAKERSTGVCNEITITNAGRLSDSELNQMIKDAEKFKRDDERLKELIELRNKLQLMAFDLRRTVFSGLSDIEFSEESVARNIDEVLQWLDDHPNADKTALTAKIEEFQKKKVFCVNLSE